MSNLAVTKGPSPIEICSNEPSKTCSSSSGNDDCSGNGVCISSFLKETYFFKERLPRFVSTVSVSDLKTGGALKVDWQSEKVLVDKYKIYYRQKGGATFQEKLISKDDCQDTGTEYVCSYNLDSLLNNVNYEIRITAINENMAETELSLSFYGTPTDSDNQSPPTDVSFEILSHEEKRVRISWVAPVDYEVSSYKVYRGVNSGVYGANFVTQGNVTEVEVSLANSENNIFYFVVSSINPIGIESAYSQEIIVPFNSDSFSGDSGTFTDLRDSQIYKWVRIGDQIWMAENLNHDNGCTSVTWVNYSDGGWCGYYNNNPAYEDYGLFYQWSAAMNGETAEGSSGICPSGWHVPTGAEWNILVDYLNDDLGDSLRASPSDTPISWDGNNDTGFTALPAGYRATNGNFNDFSSFADFWSSSEESSFVVAFYLYSGSAYIHSNNTAGGVSLRCIKNIE